MDRAKSGSLLTFIFLCLNSTSSVSEEPSDLRMVERNAAVMAMNEMWERFERAPGDDNKTVCVSTHLNVDPDFFGKPKDAPSDVFSALQKTIGQSNRLVQVSSCTVLGPIVLDDAGGPAILLEYDTAEAFVTEGLLLGKEEAPSWAPRESLNQNLKIDPEKAWFIVNYIESDGTLRFDGAGELRVGARSQYFYFDFGQSGQEINISAQYHESSIE